MIGILDYGIGNIKALQNIYKILNISTRLCKSPDDLPDIKKFILPGVGSYDWAIDKFNRSGMHYPLNKLISDNNVSVLGICVGMQMFSDTSEEGFMSGLSWISGNVKKFQNQNDSVNLRLPHMGWNTVEPKVQHPIFYNIQDFKFYFLHSYHFSTINENNVLGKTNYIYDFPSMIYNKNTIGIQFHPEKSHKQGIQLLENFYKLC